MERRDVAVFGGSGFIGRYLVRRLAAAGWRVAVAVRDPERAHFLQPLGDVGQIVPVRCDVTHRRQVEAVLAGAGALVNLVGILYQRRRRSFRRVHVEAAENIGAAAAAAGIRRAVQVSAIGAAPRSPSAYGRSKAEAEATLRRHVPQAVVLRPSIVFGPEDDFFNRFARMAALAPAIPLIGGGLTRFQPVHVDDVAAAIATALEDESAAGKTFELGGPAVYSFRALMELVRRETGRRVLLLPLPFFAGRMLASVLQWAPRPPLTPDQLRLLESDNVASPAHPGLAELGIQARTVEVEVPRYLAFYRRGGPGRRGRFGRGESGREEAG